MEFISPIKIRVEQNDCVFEGLLKRVKNKVWEQFVVMNSSEIKIDKNATVTVITKVENPVDNTPYVGLYADETHDDIEQRGSIGFYDEHLGFDREF